MHLLAFSCALNITEDALVTKLICLYYTANPWQTIHPLPTTPEVKVPFYSYPNPLFTLPSPTTHSFT